MDQTACEHLLKSVLLEKQNEDRTKQIKSQERYINLSKSAYKHNSALMSLEKLGVKFSKRKERVFNRSINSIDSEDQADKADSFYRTFNSSNMSMMSFEKNDPNIKTIDMYNGEHFLNQQKGESIRTYNRGSR